MPGPQRFQHYEVEMTAAGSPRELGRGAMGVTYKAFDTNLRCPVALKVIAQTYLDSEVAQQRFFREARAAAALRHPNVASVFHLGQEGANFFYAMEFVEGETVDALLRREGPIPVGRALQIALQVNRALAAADKQNLVHRDLKPANIMIQADSENDLLVKLIDFGLAKTAVKSEGDATLTMQGFLGTPHFASPEQLEEKDVDIRSDIYSLGVTLWCMLLGKTPYSGSLAQVMSQHLYKAVPLDQLSGFSPSVVDLLRHMLEKEPAKRPQNPLELRQEIEQCLRDPNLHGMPGVVALDAMETLVESAPPRPDDNPPSLPTSAAVTTPAPKSSNWVAIGLIGVLFLALFGGGAWFVLAKILRPKSTPGAVVSAQPSNAPAVASVAPVESVTPIPNTMATPTPTPDPEAIFAAAMSRVEEINSDGNHAADEIAGYLDLMEKYPGRDELRKRLEGISARLIRDESPLAPDEFEKIRPAIEAAAKAGIVRAQLLLAQNIRSNEPDRALELFEAVALTGNISAMRQGGLLYSVRNHTGDMLRAVALFEQGAALGDTASNLAAGETYLLGKGVPANVPKALAYLQEAAAADEPRAWDRLGDYYSKQKDFPKAFDAFSRARRLGWTPALANLGALYVNGNGVAADPVQANALFAEGAEKGDPRAMVFRAQCLEAGIGTAKNLPEARRWYGQAAAAGDKRAAAWLQKNGG